MVGLDSGAIEPEENMPMLNDVPHRLFLFSLFGWDRDCWRTDRGLDNIFLRRQKRRGVREPAAFILAAKTHSILNRLRYE